MIEFRENLFHGCRKELPMGRQTDMFFLLLDARLAVTVMFFFSQVITLVITERCKISK